MADVLRIKGLKELDRAFGKIDRDLRREMKVEIKAGAELVAADARPRAEKYGSRTAGGIKAAIRGTTGLVRQSIGGKRIRPAFGSVLLRNALLPAVEAKQEAVVDHFDQMLGRLGGDAGF